MQSSTKNGPRPAKAALTARLRRLPAVGKLLQTRPFRRLIRRWGGGLVTDLLREELGGLRGEIRAGGLTTVALRQRRSAAALAARVEQSLRRLLAPSPRAVINATGVVVHTNLGRSVLSEEAAGRVATAAAGYLDLEYDLKTGHRGSRLAHLEPLMARLFPGHGFLIVNNNAAATMLVLGGLARGKEVIVSRGELVEIGGSFRVPEILAASGAKLREVGTTNKTRLADYRGAVTPQTALFLKVHTSNFKIVGFAEETSIASLAGLARDTGLPLVVDWGSGDLVDLGPLGIHDELPARAVLEAGADLLTFSGDKLLGGAQAGFIVGRDDLVSRLSRHPLARVCRLDRLMLAALHETLAAYARGRAFRDVPTLRMLAQSKDEIGRRARRLIAEVARRVGRHARLTLADGISRTGGGSSPTGGRPTTLVALEGGAVGAAHIERVLRLGEPPVIGRVQEGRFLLDLRTVLPSQEPAVVERLVEVIAAEAPSQNRGRRGKRRRTPSR